MLIIPVFADVRAGTYCIDESQIKSLITKKTKAILVPNLIGNIADWKKLRFIANRYKLKLIEETWVKNGFQISEKQIQKIIKS